MNLRSKVFFMGASTIIKSLLRWSVAVIMLINVSPPVRADCRELLNRSGMLDFPSNPRPPGFADLAVGKGGRIIYMTAINANALMVINVGAEGRLTLAQVISGTPEHALNRPDGIAMDPQERFLYVAAAKSDALSYYPITASGSLSAPVIFYHNTTLNGKTQHLDGANQLILVGRYLYVTTYTTGAITIYTLREDGWPVDVRVTRSFADGRLLPKLGALAMSPDRDCLYVASKPDDSLLSFSVDDQGGLLWQQYYHRSAGEGLDGARHISINNDGSVLYLTLFDGNAIQPFRIGQRCTLTRLSRVHENSLVTAKQLSGLQSTTLTDDGRFLYSLAWRGRTISLFGVQSDGSLDIVKTVYTGRWVKKMALSADNAKAYIISKNALEVYDVSHSFPFLGSDEKVIAARLLDTEGNERNVFNFRLTNQGSAFNWFITAEADGNSGTTTALEAPVNNECDTEYAVAQVDLPLPDWHPAPRNYQLVIAPLHSNSTEPSFFIAGHAIPGNQDTEPDGSNDYFVIATQGGGADTSAENASELACHKVISQLISAGIMEGHFARAVVSGQYGALNSVHGTYPLSMRCLRDGNDGFLLTADTELNLDLTDHPMFTMDTLLLGYYQPEEESVIWYGLNKQPENNITETDQHPALAVPAAIVLESPAQ